MKAEEAEFLYPWLRHMARMHARACTISQVTGVSTMVVRNLWRDVNKVSPPSGQQPTDTGWYLRSAKRKMHSALLLLLYQQALKTSPKKVAFAQAYFHYASMTVSDASEKTKTESSDFRRIGAYRANEADYEIPYSRGAFLCGYYSDQIGGDGKRRLCDLQLKQCRSCQSIFLGASFKCEPKCPICESTKH
jgi:hypothetical protein